MNIVLPFSKVDINIADRLAVWLTVLHPEHTNENMYLIADHRLAPIEFETVKNTLSKRFHIRGLIVARPEPDEPDSGWPQGPNMMWRRACKWMAQIGQPWLLLEPDATPLKPTWVHELREEYKQACRESKPFLGAYVEHPWPHITGVAVYPAKLNQWVTGMSMPHPEKPFDLAYSKEVLQLAKLTNLIQHKWKTDITDLAQLSSNAVIFHGAKGSSLVDLLTAQTTSEEKKQKYIPVKKQATGPVPVMPLHVAKLPEFFTDPKNSNRVVIGMRDTRVRYAFNEESKQWVKVKAKHRDEIVEIDDPMSPENLEKRDALVGKHDDTPKPVSTPKPPASPFEDDGWKLEDKV